MRNNQHSPIKSFEKGQAKDKDFRPQMKVVFDAFYEEPKTMLMVSIETGIMRSNITWFVETWRTQEKICVVKKGTCKMSNHSTVGFYTTNRKLFPKSNQLNLF